MSSNPLVWTDDRCEELDGLGLLLREVASINKGSGCLDRIEMCIALAEKLQYTSFYEPSDSFYHFLRRLAIEDRTFNRTEMKGE